MGSSSLKEERFSYKILNQHFICMQIIPVLIKFIFIYFIFNKACMRISRYDLNALINSEIGQN